MGFVSRSRFWCWRKENKKTKDDMNDGLPRGRIQNVLDIWEDETYLSTLKIDYS